MIVLLWTNLALIGTEVSKLMTPQVVTVVGIAICALCGWKATKKGISLINDLSQRAGFLGMAAAVLFIGGVGSAGLGFGEMACRYANASPSNKGITNSQLITIAGKCNDKEMARILLDYARSRDGDKDNEEVRTLGIMVDKQIMAANGEKAMSAFLDYLNYLKVRDGNKLSKVSLGTPNSEDGPKIEPKNNDSLLSIPVSVALLGFGVASSVAGGFVFRFQQEENKRNKEKDVTATPATQAKA